MKPILMFLPSNLNPVAVANHVRKKQAQKLVAEQSSATNFWACFFLT